MKNNFRYAMRATAAACFAFNVQLHAQLAVGDVVGIDFGSIVPAAETNFNQFDAFLNNIDHGATLAFSALPDAPMLIDMTGVMVSGVDLIVGNQSGQNTSRANVTSGSTGPAPFNESSIFQDCIIANNQGAAPLDPGGFLTFTFTGLDDFLSYNLTGGFNGVNGNFDSTWEANGRSFLSTPGSETSYQSLTGLSTDGSGNLVITVTRNSLHVNVGALILEATEPPIPTSLEIVDSGFLGSDFFIEMNGAFQGLVVTSSDTLEFDSATVVNTIVDPDNARRFLIPLTERNAIKDFFRVEVAPVEE